MEQSIFSTIQKPIINQEGSVTVSRSLWVSRTIDCSYISDSIKLAIEFTEKMSFNDFQYDKKTQFAVIRCFEIIGEATKRLPDEYRNSRQDVPWKAMAGMRDRLIHGYRDKLYPENQKGV
jgi:hypothetical protein